MVYVKDKKRIYVPSGAFPDRAPTTPRGKRRHAQRSEGERKKLEERWSKNVATA